MQQAQRPVATIGRMGITVTEKRPGDIVLGNATRPVRVVREWERRR